jgi:hypothetical protein
MDCGDDDPTYCDAQIIAALRDQRLSINIRPWKGFVYNPSNYLYQNLMPVPGSDEYNSELLPEPGNTAFQARQGFRHWDSSAPVEVWVAGYLKTIDTDYTVSYPEGRVVFTSALPNFQAVCASFVYFRVYHAARQCVQSRLVSPGELISWRDADAEENYGSKSDVLRAIDQMIASFTSKLIRNAKRIY